MHYTDDQLCELLEDVDVDLSSSDLTHLESCETCRSRLSTLAGEGEWLEDLMDSVGDVTCEQPNQNIISSKSVVITVDTSDQMNDRLQCDSVRLDFLDAPTHPELLGRLGRYDIERLIGMGGYGVVFKARDSELNRVVAIKVLAPHLMNSGPARQRFAREAQASAAVVHDHVVPIFDVVNDADVCYFVMQYIPGHSLQERVDRKGPMCTEDVLQIGAQIAAGLHAAHETGLIHRDVKPGNVLLEDTVNRVMISDFGLARAADDASLTRSGTITGTPHYMSPEQARGQAIDARSDLFSLGSVIYFMCTGRSPFRASQMMAVLNRICHETHRPIEETHPHVPYELTKIVDRLLSKKPDDRFESSEEVHQRLQSLLSDFQSGKLRPRRFKPPLVLAKKGKQVIGGIAVIAGLLGAAAFVPAIRERFQEPQEKDVPVASLSTRSPASLAGLGTVRLQASWNSMNNTVAILEEELAKTQPANVVASPWNHEMFAITANLNHLEAGLIREAKMMDQWGDGSYSAFIGIESKEHGATSLHDEPSCNACLDENSEDCEFCAEGECDDDNCPDADVADGNSNDNE